jgi:hypothetical protein
MNIEIVRNFILWCIAINYGVILVWFIFFKFVHNWIYRFHGRWFRLTVEQFDSIHYAAMAIYKIGILLFNLVPYVALCMVG